MRGNKLKSYFCDISEPEPAIEDLKGEELYIRLCQELGVVPLTDVKTNMQKTHFRLPHRGIGSKGVQALAPPISVSWHLYLVKFVDQIT